VYVERRSEGHVQVLTLSRPEVRNALDTPMVEAIAAALEAAAADADVRCVVLTGGTEVFASGADIRELRDTSPMGLLTGAKDAAWRRIFSFDKPLVVGAAGYVLGGGCELAMSADVIVAADSAVFGQPEICLGILPGAGGTQRWPRSVGRYRATVVNLAGETLSAWEAADVGVVAEVVPRERVVQAAIGWGERIAQFAPLAAKTVKTAIAAAETMPLTDAMRYEKTLLSVVLSSEDAAEGFSAFLEKRPATFEGR
jgi:enoyl-CoA hydratase/carnithine racemase